jgi:putative PEP-CTERM system histidine kinase
MELGIVLAFAGAIVAAAIAVSAAVHARHSRSHWALVGGMAVLAAESLCGALAADAALPVSAAYWKSWQLLATSLLPGIWILFSLVFARGNYAEFLRKWRLLLFFVFVVPAGLAAVCRKSLISSAYPLDSGGSWSFALSVPAYLISVLILLASIVVLMNLERTFRASVGTMRWRIKYLVIGLAVLFTARAYASTQALLFHSVSSSLETVNACGLLISCLLIARSLSRAGMSQVTVYPSHSMLYGSLTAVLAGVYLVIVGVLAKLVAAFGGDNAFVAKTFIVLITLVLGAILFLSENVRLHTKRFVSRHFQRPLYDYRTVWRRFTEATARSVEQTAFCRAVVKLLSEVFQALSVSVWLLDDSKESFRLVSSTSLLKPDTADRLLDRSEAAQVIHGLASHPDPLDIDASRELWAILLRRLHPDDFRKGGNRICAPMVAGGELVGFLTFGDRVGGIAYSLQDLDLLRSVSDQSAANLLNIQLSQRLAQGKQLEAFQAMSTFFVHDLKNTASTLSLMLQNLPQHFNDPAFRQDALRGIGSSVAHIKDLIARLGSLRQEIAIRPVETNLNDVVAQVLGELHIAQSESPSSVSVLKDLKPVPNVPLDVGQFKSVVTNLILNAQEAISSTGQIKIATERVNGWVTLSVADDGCGMSREFLQTSLFRPFKTTKKKGIGIGMYQSRIIVEAHHGKIEVDSEPGKGTSFRVLLPLAHPSSSSTS